MQEKYRIQSHKYLGYNEYNTELGTYMYELHLNKSMQHTGRHSAMCYGMDEQEYKETHGIFKHYFRRLWHAIIAKKQFS